MGLSVVWFKRDLRVVDHAPLLEAVRDSDAVVCLYVIEPSLWALPEYSGRQYAFLLECLADLDAHLRVRGSRLIIKQGEVVDVLERLNRVQPIQALHAHEETGLFATWERDKAVTAWVKAHQIRFEEHIQHGVIRGLKSRNGWAKRWDQVMSRPVLPAPDQIPGPKLASDPVPGPIALGLAEDLCPQRQTGGRAAGLALLDSFLSHRGRPYRKAMSSPLKAYEACSRLSAHLAFGTVSMRESFAAASQALAQARLHDDTPMAQSIDSFIARLHWHCHFIQKFEDETEMEWRDLHPSYADARPEADPELVSRWIRGRTGLPFLDACMRALDQTGWLNFRMRAMAAAVSSYHLWQHWRRPAQALARQFVDFEPGIHYPQFQMQSGTTGVNTPRIYNPIKQGHDQDPDGVFIRQYVPELASLPTPLLHEPWRADPEALAKAGVRLGETYPERLFDHELAARQARARIGALRKGQDHKAAADAIQVKHGSRRSGMRQTGRKPKRAKPQAASDPRQTSFDF